MAEFLAAAGAVASVAQLADYAASLSVKLFSYAAAVQRADKTLGSLANEVSLASVVLKELWTVLEEERKACWSPEPKGAASKRRRVASDQAKKSYVSPRAMKAIEGTVAECLSVFKELGDQLEKSMGIPLQEFQNLDLNNDGNFNIDERNKEAPRRPPKISALNKLKFPFKEPKFHLLRTQLDRLKVSLTLMLQILTFARDYTARKEDAQNLVIQKELIEHLSKSEFELRQKYVSLKKRLEYTHEKIKVEQAPGVTLTAITTQHINNNLPPRYEDSITTHSMPMPLFPPNNESSRSIVSFASAPLLPQSDRWTEAETESGELLIAISLLQDMTVPGRGLGDDHSRLYEEACKAVHFESNRLLSMNQWASRAIMQNVDDHAERVQGLIQELVREVLKKCPNPSAPSHIDPAQPALSSYPVVPPRMPLSDTSTEYPIQQAPPLPPPRFKIKGEWLNISGSYTASYSSPPNLPTADSEDFFSSIPRSARSSSPLDAPFRFGTQSSSMLEDSSGPAHSSINLFPAGMSSDFDFQHPHTSLHKPEDSPAVFSSRPSSKRTKQTARKTNSSQAQPHSASPHHLGPKPASTERRRVRNAVHLNIQRRRQEWVGESQVATNNSDNTQISQVIPVSALASNRYTTLANQNQIPTNAVRDYYASPGSDMTKSSLPKPGRTVSDPYDDELLTPAPTHAPVNGFSLEFSSEARIGPEKHNWDDVARDLITQWTTLDVDDVDSIFMGGTQ